MPAPRPPRPEVLAPAGDEASLRAALAHGADAIYFGLDEGWNARARAGNFPRATLPQTVALIHRCGARAYLTLNVLLFEEELAAVLDLLPDLVRAGVDALIVQDPASCLLARALCPEMELHASTQMTVSSPEGAMFAGSLGVSRVVVPRELSIQEISLFAEGTDLELEVFVHGALCMSWSGQCLTSEAWGGRSANRGQCAQSCRLPYQVVLDGVEQDLGDVRYLLSPKDLAGFRASPSLHRAGVHGLKIEGRQKGPAYVATAVGAWRRWVDAVERGVSATDEATLFQDMEAMTLAWSRGFSDGFLLGADHQSLVEGLFPKHRGLYLGRVRSVEGSSVRVVREAAVKGTSERPLVNENGEFEGEILPPPQPLHGARKAASGPALPLWEPRPGMGVVFDSGHPEDKQEPGGSLFAVGREGKVRVLGFGRPGPDLAKVSPGDRVWVTSDPQVTALGKVSTGKDPREGALPLNLQVSGIPGESLRITGETRGFRASVESESTLEPSSLEGLTPSLLREKMGALGGTPFHLSSLDSEGLTPGLHLPVSALKALRRRLVDSLLPQVERGKERGIRTDASVEGIRDSLRREALKRFREAGEGEELSGEARVIPLCRTREQLEAAVEAGCAEVELDFMDWVGLGRAVRQARDAGVGVTVATVRVQKPGEEGYDARVAKLSPDGVLVRHWGAVTHFALGEYSEATPRIHGDFSLNITNSLTGWLVLSKGLSTLTAAHDLDERQLFALLRSLPASRVTVTVHHHIPTFHTEHCVYAHLLSRGRDHRTCGRPCEEQSLGLKDPQGKVHPVVVDVACRNTVFNARAQSAAFLVPRLLRAGVKRFRVEFVREGRDEGVAVLRAFQELLEGRLSPRDLVQRVGVHEQFGVTRGTMQVLQ